MPDSLLQPEQLVARRSTLMEGLYAGLVRTPSSTHQSQSQGQGQGQGQGQAPTSLMEAKLKLLVETPAAVEDALASLLNHIDPEVQVGNLGVCVCVSVSATVTRYTLCRCTPESTCWSCLVYGCQGVPGRSYPEATHCLELDLYRSGSRGSVLQLSLVLVAIQHFVTWPGLAAALDSLAVMSHCCCFCPHQKIVDSLCSAPRYHQPCSLAFFIGLRHYLANN